VSGFLEGNFTDAALYFDYIYVVDFDNPIWISPVITILN
jgi:hypothetical protein